MGIEIVGVDCGSTSCMISWLGETRIQNAAANVLSAWAGTVYTNIAIPECTWIIGFGEWADRSAPDPQRPNGYRLV